MHRVRRAVAMAAATVVAAATALVATVPASAAETVISCNQVVSGAIKVANDLTCVESDGLIATSNTVIDLNGHRIVCVGNGYKGSCQGIVNGSPAPDEEPENGIYMLEADNVHIVSNKPGGTIEGFDNGVEIDRSSDVKVERLIITGPPSTEPANPRPFSHAVRVRGSNCPPTDDANIHIGAGEFKGNDLSNHNQGIAINGNCVHVVHNKVHDNNSNGSVPSNGILLNNASRNVVRANEVFRNGDLIDNLYEDGGITIRNRSSQNHLTNNTVTNNIGDGISVRLGASENKIDNNIMLFSGGPFSGTLYYDAAGRFAPANEWNQNNQCVTQNQEVPPGTCGPDEASTSSLAL